MNVLELLGLGPRGPELPALPPDTLPKITERLNGGSEVPSRISQALDELLNARGQWAEHLDKVITFKQSAIAEGADEKQRRKIRDAEALAREEIQLLTDGEPALRARLAKTQRRVKDGSAAFHITKMIEAWPALRDAVLAAEAAQIAFSQAREDAVRSVGEQAIARFPFASFLFNGFLGRGFAAPWADENNRLIDRYGLSNYHAGRIAEAEVAARAGAAAKAGANADAPATPPYLVKSQPRVSGSMQHPIDKIGRPISAAPKPSAPLRVASRPKAARELLNDDSPLGAGESRVIIIHSGLEIDGRQHLAGDVVKMPSAEARQAGLSGSIQIVEIGLAIAAAPESPSPLSGDAA